MPPVGSNGKATGQGGQGLRPLKLKKIKNYVSNTAFWIWLFDLLMLSDISSITAYLLYTLGM